MSRAGTSTRGPLGKEISPISVGLLLGYVGIALLILGGHTPGIFLELVIATAIGVAVYIRTGDRIRGIVEKVDQNLYRELAKRNIYDLDSFVDYLLTVSPDRLKRRISPELVNRIKSLDTTGIPSVTSRQAGTTLAFGVAGFVALLFILYTTLGLVLGFLLLLTVVSPQLPTPTPLKPYLKAVDLSSIGHQATASGRRTSSPTSTETVQGGEPWEEIVDPMAVRSFAVSHASEYRPTRNLETNVRQVVALFEYVSQEIQYVSDPKSEYTAPPNETLDVGGGDCDCQAVLAASLFEAIGASTRLVWVDSAFEDATHLLPEVSLGTDPSSISAEIESFYQDQGRTIRNFAYETDSEGMAWYVADPACRYLGDIQGLKWMGAISDEEPWGWYNLIDIRYPHVSATH